MDAGDLERDGAVDAVVGTSAYLVSRWRSGDTNPGAQVLHHALRVLGDARLPQSDPLFERLEDAVQVSTDFDSEFGLYCSAIAAVKPLTHSLRAESEVRLANPGGLGGSRSRHSPYDKQTLERLLVIEALCTAPDADRDASVLHVHLSRILEHDLAGALPPDVTYPLSLAAVLDQHVHPDLANAFEDILLSYERGNLCYDDIRFDSLVVLNAARVQGLLPNGFYQEFWSQGVRLITNLVALSDIPLTTPELIESPSYLVQAAPYARVLLHAPETSLAIRQPRNSSEWVATTRAALERDITAAKAERQAISDALCKVVKSSLIVHAEISQLSGGRSSSAVYTGTLVVEQPFKIAGPRVIFKTDVSPAERESFATLRQIKLSHLFAKVLSEPEFATMPDGSVRPVFIYEHLAPMETLQTVLEGPWPLDSKLDLLHSVVSSLAVLWEDHPLSSRPGDTTSVQAQVLQVASKLYIVNVPAIKREVQDLVVDTQHVLDQLPRHHYRSQAVVHGDLNCRNILVDTSASLQLERVKLIDYETITFGGDAMVDVGELIEDVHAALGRSPQEHLVERRVLQALPHLADGDNTPLGTRRLLAQLRSCCTLTKFALVDSSRRAAAVPAISRWRVLLERLSQANQVGTK